jgi:hypothetical protein
MVKIIVLIVKQFYIKVSLLKFEERGGKKLKFFDFFIVVYSKNITNFFD